MKLLLDQNLAPSLVPRLGDLYPGSRHVRDVELSASDDTAVWEYAKQHGFCIVSKDSDFQQRSLLYGAPPKVVWLRIGNCTTALIEDLLRKYSAEIHTLDTDPTQSILALS
jgi:predicted nuclease of predicted toxin-antitoxin system